MRTPIRKLIESTIVSLDGVVESPDRWALFDREAVQFSLTELERDLVKYGTSRFDATLLPAGLRDGDELRHGLQSECLTPINHP